MLRNCISLALTLVLLVAAARAEEIRSAGDSSSPILDRKVSLSFTNDSLNTVAKTISNEAGANIVVEVAGLEDAGINPDRRAVTIQLQGIRLKDALDVILKPHGLTWSLCDDVIKITSPAGANPMFADTYSVVDLVARRNVAEGQNAIDPLALQQIADFLKTSVEPDSWADAGGAGSVVVSEQTASLVVRQTQEVHDQIRETLDMLRRLDDLRVTVEFKVIRIPAYELLQKGDELLRPRTLSDLEQAAWQNGEHRWSDATVLQWADLTFVPGQQYRMANDDVTPSVSFQTTVSEDRSAVLLHVSHDATPDPDVISVPDGRTAILPVRNGRIPLIENGHAFVIVLAPRIQAVEEEEELLSTVRR